MSLSVYSCRHCPPLSAPNQSKCTQYRVWYGTTPTKKSEQLQNFEISYSCNKRVCLHIIFLDPPKMFSTNFVSGGAKMNCSGVFLLHYTRPTTF